MRRRRCWGRRARRPGPDAGTWLSPSGRRRVAAPALRRVLSGVRPYRMRIGLVADRDVRLGVLPGGGPTVVDEFGRWPSWWRPGESPDRRFPCSRRRHQFSPGPADRPVYSHRPRGGLRREAHLPAQQPPPFPQAWVPAAHANPCRPRDRAQSPSPWPRQADGLNRVVPPQRLRRSRDIGAVFGGRRQRAGRLVVLHAREADDPLQPARLAVIASRRVGGAVARNRAKRLVREAARHTALRDGWDLVVVTRPACAKQGLDEVRDEFALLAGRLGLLASTPSNHPVVLGQGEDGVVRPAESRPRVDSRVTTTLGQQVFR